MRATRFTRQGVRNLNDSGANGKADQSKCKHINEVVTDTPSRKRRLCLDCGLSWWLTLLAIIVAFPTIADAQLNPRQLSPRQPKACLATVFANIDRSTGKVEKMAGEQFFCTRKKTSARAFGIAHRRWPCGTRVLIVNIRNGRSVVAPVIDRGPYWAVPRSCSRDALGFASHSCWSKGKPVVKNRFIGRKRVHGNCVDVTPPVARRLRLRGKEPVIIYRLPKRRYQR